MSIKKKVQDPYRQFYMPANIAIPYKHTTQSNNKCKELVSMHNLFLTKHYGNKNLYRCSELISLAIDQYALLLPLRDICISNETGKYVSFTCKLLLVGDIFLLRDCCQCPPLLSVLGPLLLQTCAGPEHASIVFENSYVSFSCYIYKALLT